MPRLCSNKDCRAELPEGRTSHRCKDCTRVYSAKMFEKYPERWAAYQQQRYAANPERENTRVRRWCEANPEKKREQTRRRRAKKRGCTVGVVDEHLVVEQARGICQICGNFVPERLREIDHIVPLDKGGPHSQENLQLLCRKCNRKKGAKMPKETHE